MAYVSVFEIEMTELLDGLDIKDYGWQGVCLMQYLAQCSAYSRRPINYY